MKTLSMSINHKRIYVVFTTLLVFLNILFFTLAFGTVFVLFYVMSFHKIILIAPTYFVINWSLTMCMLTFILFLFSIYARFDLINYCLKQHFATQEEDTENFKKKPTKHLPRLVMKLSDLHDNLVDVTTQLNYCFAFQMMNIVAGMFCTNIFSTFSIYRVFVRNDFKDFYNASVQYAWNIYFLAFGCCVLTLASLMTRTGKFTAVLVHKAINFIDDDDDPIVDYVSKNRLSQLRFSLTLKSYVSAQNIFTTNGLDKNNLFLISAIEYIQFSFTSASSSSSCVLRFVCFWLHSFVHGKFSNHYFKKFHEHKNPNKFRLMQITLMLQRQLAKFQILGATATYIGEVWKLIMFKK